MPPDHFTDTHLGKVCSCELRQRGLPRGKLEFPLCSVTTFNTRKRRGNKTPTLQVILTSYKSEAKNK